MMSCVHWYLRNWMIDETSELAGGVIKELEDLNNSANKDGRRKYRYYKISSRDSFRCNNTRCWWTNNCFLIRYLRQLIYFFIISIVKFKLC